MSNKLDSVYRKGVVLGLSLAEIFLVLLFLLLVVTVNIVTEAKIIENERIELSDQLSSLEEQIKKSGGKIEELDFEELFKVIAKSKLLEDEVDSLRELIDLKPIKEALELTKFDSELKKEILDTVTDLIKQKPDILASNLVETIDKSKEIRLENSQLKKENKELLLKTQTLVELDIVKKLEEEKNELLEKVDTLIEPSLYKVLEKEKNDLISKIDSFSIEKGELPSCWYIKKTTENKREKEIKIFDVKMSDNSVMVMKRKSKENKNHNYGDLSGLPSFPENYLGKELSYDNFFNKFNSFYQAGEKKKIQSYRCRFFIGLWDLTTSKKSYQNRLATIEGLFYKYRYKDQKWPYYKAQAKTISNRNKTRNTAKSNKDEDINTLIRRSGILKQ